MKRLVYLVVIALVVGFVPFGTEYNAYNQAIAYARVWKHLAIDFQQLSSSASEQDMLRRYSHIKWTCEDERPAYGDRACYGHVRQINGVPGWLAVFFFDKDKLTMVKLDVLEHGHAPLVGSLTGLLGAPRERPLDDDKGLGWIVADGYLTTTAKPYAYGPSQFLWISKEKAGGGRAPKSASASPQQKQDLLSTIYLGTSLLPDGKSEIKFVFSKGSAGKPAYEPMFGFTITPANGECNIRPTENLEVDAEYARRPLYDPNEKDQISTSQLPVFFASVVSGELARKRYAKTAEDSLPYHTCTRIFWEDMIKKSPRA